MPGRSRGILHSRLGAEPQKVLSDFVKILDIFVSSYLTAVVITFCRTPEDVENYVESVERFPHFPFAP